MTIGWFIVVTVGPLLLLAILVWAWLRNRGSSASTNARAESGARELREDIRDDPEYR